MVTKFFDKGSNMKLILTSFLILLASVAQADWKERYVPPTKAGPTTWQPYIKPKRTTTTYYYPNGQQAFILQNPWVAPEWPSGISNTRVTYGSAGRNPDNRSKYQSAPVSKTRN